MCWYASAATGSAPAWPLSAVAGSSFGAGPRVVSAYPLSAHDIEHRAAEEAARFISEMLLDGLARPESAKPALAEIPTETAQELS